MRMHLKPACQIARTEGVLVGISSGAAIWAAKQLAKRPENKERQLLPFFLIQVRYLSTPMFAE